MNEEIKLDISKLKRQKEEKTLDGVEWFPCFTKRSVEDINWYWGKGELRSQYINLLYAYTGLLYLTLSYGDDRKSLPELKPMRLDILQGIDAGIEKEAPAEQSKFVTRDL